MDIPQKAPSDLLRGRPVATSAAAGLPLPLTRLIPSPPAPPVLPIAQECVFGL